METVISDRMSGLAVRGGTSCHSCFTGIGGKHHLKRPPLPSNPLSPLSPTKSTRKATALAVLRAHICMLGNTIWRSAKELVDCAKSTGAETSEDDPARGPPRIVERSKLVASAGKGVRQSPLTSGMSGIRSSLAGRGCQRPARRLPRRAGDNLENLADTSGSNVS